jgi:copper chaperone CopZ
MADNWDYLKSGNTLKLLKVNGVEKWSVSFDLETGKVNESKKEIEGNIYPLDKKIVSKLKANLTEIIELIKEDQKNRRG